MTSYLFVLHILSDRDLLNAPSSTFVAQAMLFNEVIEFDDANKLLYSLVIVNSTFFVIILCYFLNNRDNQSSYERLQSKFDSNLYTLRPRFKIWMRQVCFAAILVSTLVSLQSRSKLDSKSIIQELISHPNVPIICFSFMLSLSFDSINNISSNRAKKSWLVVYCLMLPYFVISCAQNIDFSRHHEAIGWTYISFHSSLQLVLLITAVMFTTAEVFATQHVVMKSQPTTEFTCGLLSYLTHSYLNKILIDPMQHKVMEFEDVPHIVDSDESWYCWNKMELLSLENSSNHIPKTVKRVSIYRKVFRVIKADWLIQGFFQFMACTAEVVAPIALQVILTYVRDSTSSKDSLPVNDSASLSIQLSDANGQSKSLFSLDVYTASFLMFFGPLMKALSDAQNFSRAKRIGQSVSLPCIKYVHSF